MTKRSVTHLTTNSKITKDEQWIDADGEWFTPYWILELVRVLFDGEIDLDPASTEEANIAVKAKNFYTKEQDGLQQSWHGKIFCNPPYGRRDMLIGYVGLFVQKALFEYKQKNFTEAILLLPVNATVNYFFQVVGIHPVCILYKKVFFRRSKRKPIGKNMLGTMLVYLGAYPERFIEVFQSYGLIILPDSCISHCIEAERG